MSYTHEYDITWLVESIKKPDIVIIEEQEFNWLDLPPEIWVMIFDYAIVPRNLFYSTLLRVCKTWNEILLTHIYTSLITVESRHIWMGDLVQFSSEAVYAVNDTHAQHSGMLEADSISYIFRRLLYTLRIRVLTNLIYFDDSESSIIALKKKKTFMHICYGERHCSFITAKNDILDTGIRRYVRFFLEIVLQSIFRECLIDLEEEYLLSPDFNGSMLIDKRRIIRRPFAERTNPIQNFSRCCVTLLQKISNNISLEIIDAFVRHTYTSHGVSSILKQLKYIDRNNDIKCSKCEIVDNNDDDNDEI